MPGHFALYVIAIFVTLPSTLAAAFWSLPGIGFTSDALRHHDHAPAALAMLAAMLAGWFGLTTLWRLHDLLLQGCTDFNRPVACGGLVCGGLVSLALIVVTGGTLFFRVSVFGWPLLAAGYFMVVLWRLRAPSGQAPPMPR